MGRTKTRGLKPDIRPLIRHFGWQEILGQTGLRELIDQVGVKPIIDQVGVKPIIDQVGLAPFLASLTPDQRQEALRLLEETPSSTED